MAEESGLKPALTAEEWKYLDYRPLGYHLGIRIVGDVLSIQDKPYHTQYALGGRNRHATAALALYDQPFGFTDEDIHLLRFVVDSTRHGVRLSEDALAKIDAIADRIAALLPL